MLTIAGLILFTLLWAFAFSGLLECFSPLKKQLKKSIRPAARSESVNVWDHRTQF